MTIKIEDSGKILRIVGSAGEKHQMTSDLRLMVGDERLGSVKSIDIHEILPNNVITATITLLVRIGDA